MFGRQSSQGIKLALKSASLVSGLGAKNFFEKSLEDNFWKLRFYVRFYVILHP